ncbi:YihY/virulence factor BrkB family protein [Pirellulaceae bacterium SH467]|jgi:membrane protein
MDRKPSDSPPSEENFGFTEVTSAITARSTGWLKSFFPNLRDAAIRWTEDDAGSLAASVAYYLALSLFPMMLLLTSGIGLFLEFSNIGRDAESKVMLAVEQQSSPVVKQQIEEVLRQLRNQSIVSGPFGIAAAILAAIGVFAQIDRGFDRIFRIPPQKSATVRRTIYRLVRHRCFAFLMLVSLGGTILVLFASSMLMAQFRSLTGSTLPSLQHVFHFFDTAVTVGLNGVLFGFVYRWLPKKKVHWLDALRGGLLAACVWELGRTLLGMFFIGMRYTSAYGVIGSFIAILLWCYYGISILFFGAEYVQVLEIRRRARMETTEAADSASATVAHEEGATLERGRRELAVNPEPAIDYHTEVGRSLPSKTSSDVRQQPRRSFPS